MKVTSGTKSGGKISEVKVPNVENSMKRNMYILYIRCNAGARCDVWKGVAASRRLVTCAPTCSFPSHPGTVLLLNSFTSVVFRSEVTRNFTKQLQLSLSTSRCPVDVACPDSPQYGVSTLTASLRLRSQWFWIVVLFNPRFMYTSFTSSGSTFNSVRTVLWLHFSSYPLSYILQFIVE